jgi:hypothetical protein
MKILSTKNPLSSKAFLQVKKHLRHPRCDDDNDSKLWQSITSRHALQGMLKEVLQVEMKEHCWNSKLYKETVISGKGNHIDVYRKAAYYTILFCKSFFASSVI